MNVPLSKIPPSLEEFKACAVFFERGLLQPEDLADDSKRRRLQLCPLCTLKHGAALTRADEFALKNFPKRFFTVNCHTFLVDAMCFLTTLPTAEAEREIWPDVRRAYNMCLYPSNHSDNMSDKDLLQFLIISLTSTVHACLKSTRKDSTMPASTRFGTNGAWPTSVTDILPGGSTRSAFANFLHCWSRNPLWYMNSLLETLLQLPSIAYDAAAALMDVRQMFLPVYTGGLTWSGQEVQCLSVGSQETREAHGILSSFVTLGGTILGLFIMLKMPHQEFVAGYEDVLNAAFDEAARAEGVLPAPAFPLRLITVRLGFLADRHASNVSGQHLAALLSPNASFYFYPSGEDVYTRFYDIASPRSRDSKCWARDCQRYGQIESVKLMRCARCRVVQYCSRECQRSHWKSVILPHKVVCAALARIQDISPFASGDYDAHAFSLACRNAGIQIEDLLRPYQHIGSRESFEELSDAEGVHGASRSPVRDIVLT